MKRNGLEHLVPFKHEDFHSWTQSLQLGFGTYHKKSDLIIGGGLTMFGIIQNKRIVHC